MANGNGFWKKLFFGSEPEEKGLSIADVKSIQNTMGNEYGLIILKDDASEDEMINRRFRKLSGDALARIDQLFAFVPQIAASNATGQAVNAAFKAATEGTYRVRLGAGMHLCRSHLTPGAYRAVGLSDINNKVTGNAELFANDAVLSVSNAPQLALGVFNVASLVTGQYFMSQINTKLERLNTSVGRLEKLIDAQRHGELKTVAQELSDIMDKMRFIILDTDKTNATINQIKDNQRIANSAMNTCQELLYNELNALHPDDKLDIIKAHVESIVKSLVEYQYATYLYGIATLLEVQLKNITDPDELVAYRNQINKRVDQYKTDYDKAYSATIAYLDKTHVLNDRSALQWIASGAAAGLSALATGLSGIIASAKTFTLVDGLFSDHQKKQKQEIKAQADDGFAPLMKTAALESPASSIDLFIESVGREIEFVKIGNEYYTNLPES